jgi:hypothetical protein
MCSRHSSKARPICGRHLSSEEAFKGSTVGRALAANARRLYVIRKRKARGGAAVSLALGFVKGRQKEGATV